MLLDAFSIHTDSLQTRIQEGNLPLDPVSEILALSSTGNTKNLVVTSVDLKGEIDMEALDTALKLSLQSFPQLLSCLEEIKDKGRYHLHRKPLIDVDVPITVWKWPNEIRSESSLDTVIHCLAPILDRDRDLFSELPVELHLIELYQNYHILTLIAHHVAADGVTSSEIGYAILKNYHEVVTGQNLSLTASKQALSISGKKNTPVRKTTWKDYKNSIRQACMPLVIRPVLPIGTGSVEDQAEYHIKRVLTTQKSRLFARESQKRIGPLIDILVASANQAIDSWNNDRKVAPGRITTAVTVNMKGRFGKLNDPNNSSVLYFKSHPEEREDFRSYVRSLLHARINQFRYRMDLYYFKGIRKIRNALSRLPFRARQKIVHYIMRRHQTSITITYMGVVWPKVEDGRPSTDSCLSTTGGLSVGEVHATGYKLLSRTHLVLTVYIFQSRLNLVLSAAASHFTKEEADAFLDLIIRHLLSCVAE